MSIANESWGRMRWNVRVGFVGADTSWYFRDLVRAAGDRCEMIPIPFSTLGARIGSAGHEVCTAQRTLHEVDVLLVRSMPPGSLEQVIVRMDVLGQWHERGGIVVNSPRSLEVSIDKYLSLARMMQAGLPVPETHICQTVDDGLQAFEALSSDVVLKPLFGGEGRGITRLTDPDLARRAFQMLVPLGAVLYMQRYIDHPGSDLRVFVVGEKMFAMRRSNPFDWRTNVSRGATTEPLELTAPMRHLARAAVDAVGAEIGAVDLLPDRDGQLWVIEVNAVPGWRALSKTLKLDVARLVLDFLEEKLIHRKNCWS